jgi:cyclopropane-fatty-acyl-phospholipid synthase
VGLRPPRDFVARVARGGLSGTVWGWRETLALVTARLWNAGRRTRAFEIGERHYDLGNDLFEAMLDRRMTYSCAYWDGASDLDAAQEAKLDLVCRKVGLAPGMRVLDIGSGWGSFARARPRASESKASGAGSVSRRGTARRSYPS